MNPENNGQSREQYRRHMARRAAYGSLAVAGLALLLRVGVDEVRAVNPSCTPALAVTAERTGDFNINIGDVSVTANKGESIGNLAVVGNCLDANLPRQFEQDPFVKLNRFGPLRSPEAGRAVVIDENGGQAGYRPWNDELGVEIIFNAQPGEVLVVYPDEDGVVAVNSLTGNFYRVKNQDDEVAWMRKGDLREPVLK